MNGHSPTGVLAAIIAFLLGGVVAEALTDALTLAGAITVLAVGFARYGTVLRLRGASLKAEARERLVDEATASGFFVGVVLSVAILVADRLA